MNLSKVSKESLYTQLQAAQSETAIAKQQTQNVLAIANYLNGNISAISDRINTLGFAAGPKNTIMWIITNRKAIIALIEFIIAVVKEVKAKIEELTNNKGDEPQSNNPS